jgi:MFS family permease
MLATYLPTIVAAPLAGKLSERIGTARIFLSAAGLCFAACVLSLFRKEEDSESNIQAVS